MIVTENKRNRHKTSHRVKQFISLDGEAVEGKYCFIGSSVGESLYDRNGIKTGKALRWLLSLEKKYPDATFVGFAFNYDINMILRDLSLWQKTKLYKTNKVRWYDRGQLFTINWVQRKFVRITSNGVTISINDVFGFFQSSFVKALEKWDVGSSDIISRMKAERSDFKFSQIRTIKKYCMEECKLLTELMNSLDNSLYEAGISVSGWYGAGCIAAGILKQNNIHKSHVREESWNFDCPGISDYIMRAYFGGRVELFQMGEFDTISVHDINSAYPNAIRALPVLSGGHWERMSDFDPTEKWGLYQCEWDLISDNDIVMPFPWRTKKDIYYPKNGKGWYYAPEVSAAISAYPTSIRIRQAYRFVPAEDNLPFDFVNDLFQERRRAKEQGLASEKALKLGLNSLYGKTAQGYSKSKNGPPYRNYFWAGYVTSQCRADVFRVCMQNPEAIISIATDGITSSVPLRVVEGNELGEWDSNEYVNALVVQAGIYEMFTADGERKIRSRGFFPHEINWNDLREGWREDGLEYINISYPTRFIGLGTALQRNDISLHGRWITSRRALRFFPQRKWPTDGYPLPVGHKPQKTMRVDSPFGGEFFTESAAYVPKQHESEDIFEMDSYWLEDSDQPRYDMGI